MITGKSIKIEQPVEDEPQKPTAGSIKSPEQLDQEVREDEDVFQEKMMQSIIDSKGRDLYELVYKVANEYVSFPAYLISNVLLQRNERFSELSQIRIKAETTAILED